MVFANLTTVDEPICGPPKDDPAFVGITVYGEQFYPQNHVGRGWGIRNGAMGAVSPTQDPSTNNRCLCVGTAGGQLVLPDGTHLVTTMYPICAPGKPKDGGIRLFSSPKGDGPSSSPRNGVLVFMTACTLSATGQYRVTLAPR